MNPNDQANPLADLAREMDIPETILTTIRTKWQAGQGPVSEKERVAFAHFDAHPETFGTRRQDTAALPKDLQSRGAGDFDENRQADPSR